MQTHTQGLFFAAQPELNRHIQAVLGPPLPRKLNARAAQHIVIVSLPRYESVTMNIAKATMQTINTFQSPVCSFI